MAPKKRTLSAAEDTEQIRQRHIGRKLTPGRYLVIGIDEFWKMQAVCAMCGEGVLIPSTMHYTCATGRANILRARHLDVPKESNEATPDQHRDR